MLDVIYTHTSCSFFQPHDDKRFKKGDVIVPIALPHNWNDKCNFQPPEDVMVVGSYGADTCIKPQPQVDLAILLPKVCLFKAVLHGLNEATHLSSIARIDICHANAIDPFCTWCSFRTSCMRKM